MKKYIKIGLILVALFMALGCEKVGVGFPSFGPFGVTCDIKGNRLSWNPQADPDGDLGGFKLYHRQSVSDAWRESHDIKDPLSTTFALRTAGFDTCDSNILTLTAYTVHTVAVGTPGEDDYKALGSLKAESGYATTIPTPLCWGKSCL